MNDPVKALESIKNGICAGFHVIVVDLLMPRLNGIAFIQQMKKLNVNVPIVVVTSITDTEVHERALELGAGHVAQKPLKQIDMQAIFESLSKKIEIAMSSSALY